MAVKRIPSADLTAAMAKKTRKFEFIRTNGAWSINGKTWADVVASDYEYVWADPALDDVEVWEFVNKSGGWAHPVHNHHHEFRILSRNGVAPKPGVSVDGFIGYGRRDVAPLQIKEEIRVIARFSDLRGRYVMHCHNVVHEDHAMMIRFDVV